MNFNEKWSTVKQFFSSGVYVEAPPESETSVKQAEKVEDRSQVSPELSERSCILDGKVFPPNFQKILDATGWNREDGISIVLPTGEKLTPGCFNINTITVGGNMPLGSSGGPLFGSSIGSGPQSTICRGYVDGYELFANVNDERSSIKPLTMEKQIEVEFQKIMKDATRIEPPPTKIIKSKGVSSFRVIDCLEDDIRDLAGFCTNERNSRGGVIKDKIKNQEEKERLFVERLEQQRLRDLGIKFTDRRKQSYSVVIN